MKLLLLHLSDTLRFLPLPFRISISQFLFIILYVANGSKRRAVNGNLFHILEREPRWSETMRVFTEYGRYWAESADVKTIWRQRQRRYHGPLFPLSVHRLVGLTFHLGNFELFGPEYYNHYQRSLPVVAERLHPAFLFTYFRKKRRERYLEAIAHDNPGGILRTLHRGDSMGIVCDRTMRHGSGIAAELFGMPVRLPLKVVEIALRDNIPVFVTYAVNRKTGIDFYSHAIMTTDIDSAVKEICLILENAVRRFPFEWHILSPFWTDDS